MAAAVARGDEAVLARAEDGSVAVAVSHQGEVAIAVAENGSAAFASSWQGGSALAVASGQAEAVAEAFGPADSLAAARRILGAQLELLLSVWVPPQPEASAIAGGRVGSLVDCLAVGPESEEPPAPAGRSRGRGEAGAEPAATARNTDGEGRHRHVTRRHVHPAATGGAGEPVVSAVVREMEAVLRQFETAPNREAAADLKAAVALVLASVTG